MSVSASAALRPGPVTFGVVGAGDAGWRHARALVASDTPIGFIADADLEQATRLSERLGRGIQCVRPDEIDWPTVEAVCVCTPPDSHAHLAGAAVKAGRHVMIEKPLTARYDQLDDLRGLVAAGGPKVGAICQHRFSDAADAVAKRVADRRRAGSRVLSASARIRRRRDGGHYAGSWKGDPAVAGGGAVLSLGFHALDLACWWLGRPMEVVALQRAAGGASVEAAMVAGVRFEDGVLLALEVAADAGPTQPDEICLLLQDDVITWRGDAAQIDGAWVAAGAEDLHQRQLAAFCAAIRGEPGYAPSVEDVAPTLALVSALYESARLGRSVPVRL